MTAQEIADKLKEQWRPYHFGRCYIFSKGDECCCHLCLIDELAELAQRGVQADCEHSWVSADNEVVSGGEICKKCLTIRATA